MENVCYITDKESNVYRYQVNFRTEQVLKSNHKSDSYYEQLVDTLLDSYRMIVWQTKHPELLKRARRLGNQFNGRIMITEL